MYKVTDSNGNVLQLTDDIRFVRFKESTGVWIRTTQWLAECVAINGVRYSIAGRKPVDDAPTVVFVREVDAAEELLAATNELTQTQAALIDVYETTESNADVLIQVQLALTELYESVFEEV